MGLAGHPRTLNTTWNHRFQGCGGESRPRCPYFIFMVLFTMATCIHLSEVRNPGSDSWHHVCRTYGKVGAKRLYLHTGFENGKARGAGQIPRPQGRWLSYARRRALPVCGSYNPRRTTLHTLQDLKMGGGVKVSIVAQERRKGREREGFHRGAGAPRRTGA